MSAALAVCMEAFDETRRGVDRLVRLSMLSHYYYARKAIGKPCQPPVGLELEDGLTTAIERGFCEYDAYPDGTSARDGCPKRPFLRLTPKHRLLGQSSEPLGYRKLSATGSADAWIDSLRHAYPLILSFQWNSSYQNIARGRSVLASSRRPHFGRHAVAVIGFDSTDDQFIIKDSRGSSFGANGLWRLPRELTRSQMFEEVYAITGVHYVRET
ncbi:MAG TPA: hypothetical protein PKN33_13840 [Phycisphaerae bacterium]|nr:hypothetical protein [Phycisphaerae bacterium]